MASQVGRERRAALRRRPEPRPHVALECELQQGLRESVHVAGLHEESFAAILRQVREVAGMPADDREAESHRLAPDRPVRLARSRKHEDVGCSVEGRDLLEREGPVHDHAAGEVGLREARPHACRVACIGRIVAGEVERPRVVRKSRERLEKLEDPFLRQPVGDGKERGSPPSSKVRWRTCWRRRYVPSRGDDSNPRARETPSTSCSARWSLAAIRRSARRRASRSSGACALSRTAP